MQFWTKKQFWVKTFPSECQLALQKKTRQMDTQNTEDWPRFNLYRRHTENSSLVDEQVEEFVRE